MTNNLENTLGKKPISPEREIPGTFNDEWREFRYISVDEKSKFSKTFDNLFRNLNPRNAKSGGVLMEYCKIRLPDGSLFEGLSYKGDIEGWRKDAEQGAHLLNLLTARIEDNKIVVSDGRSVNLADCLIEFY